MTPRTALYIVPRFLLAAALSLAVACEKTTAEPEKPKPPEPVTTAAPPPSPATARQATPPPTAAQPAAIPAPPDVGKPPADAKKTASGLQTKVLTPGTGKAKPKPDDKVKVHYSGWTKDGKMFDSSLTRGQPAVFGVGQVIKGWTEALQLMVVGEKRRLWIPAALAYGENAGMGAPAGDLTFDVELLEIVQAPKPPEVPKDVKAAPKDAKKTASGLAYKVLQKGKGKEHPTATSRVTVHYSGWTTDGKMFDSSVVRGEPTTFPLNGVIKGWTEGVQLMTVGEKARFWIPADLAYGEKATRPGAPSGMLVFDIELISMQ
jgi:FKBP-type peptidyl-prolyl cis-trans isomerase